MEAEVRQPVGVEDDIGRGAARGFYLVERGACRRIHDASALIEFESYAAEGDTRAGHGRYRAGERIDGEDLIGVGIRTYQTIGTAVI